VKQARATRTVVAAGSAPAALRREQPNDQSIWHILEELEAVQLLEWKHITERSPMYKCYWTQWRSLAMENGILHQHWESGEGRSKLTQIVLPPSIVKDMKTELHGEPSSGQFGVNKTLEKFLSRYYWLQARNDVENWCRQCDTCAASRSPRTRNRGQWISTTGGPVLKDGHPRSRAFHTQRPRPFSTKKLGHLRKHWLPTSAASEHRGSCIMIRDVTSSPVL
jgi:hypothetical protein